MKKVISLLLLLGLLVGVTAVFSSCNGKEPVGGGAQISVYLGGEIVDFNPQGNQTSDAMLAIIRLIFEPLFSVEKDGDLVLAGAKSYKIDKAEGKVTINLRESYWSDGTTPVRASDYIYAWKRLLKKETDNPAATLLYDVKNAVKIKQGDANPDYLGAVALDNDTIEITFEDGFTSYDLFLRNLANVALSPLNEKALINREDYWSKKSTTISSNGPFRVTSLDFLTKSFRLERNRRYHRPADSKASVDKYVIPAALQTIWNQTAGLSDDKYVASLIDELAEKTIFYVGEVPKDVREANRKNAVITDALSTYSYLFNCEKGIFQKAEVRRVLSAVLDREEIAALAVYGKPATGLIPKTVSEGTKYNSWTAKTQLSTKGMSLEDAKAALTAAGVTSGSFTLTYRKDETTEAIAKYAQIKWRALGFNVTLEEVSNEYKSVDPTTGAPSEEDDAITYYEDGLQKKYDARDYDVIAIDYQMFSTNALAVLSTFTSTMCGGGMEISSLADPGATYDQLINNTNEATYTIRGNRMNFVSAEYDAKMEEAYAEKDPAKRNVLLHEAEEILLSEMPIIPLLFNQRAYISSKQLSGLWVDRYGFVCFTTCKQKNYKKYLEQQQEQDQEQESEQEQE